MSNKAEFDFIIKSQSDLQKTFTVVEGLLKELVKLNTESNKTKKVHKETAKATDELAGANKRAAAAIAEHDYKQSQGIRGTASAGRSMSKLAQTIGSGPNGLVGAYASLAANAFAVSAAFTKLREAAQVEQMMKGLETQGARTGKSLVNVSKSIQELTAYSLSAADAMQATALMSSAGFSSKGMEDLTKVAYNAALALGRNVPDALDRISKGVTKLEPELLDELGIMTKLTEAQSMYALQNNKSVASLTSFEKRQAMLNAVVAEGTAKFGGLSDEVEANPYDQLAATFNDLSKNVLSFVNIVMGPIAKIFGDSQGMLLGAVILFVSTIKRQLMPALFEAQKNSEKAQAAHLKEAENIKKKTEETLKNAKATKLANMEAARSKVGTIAGSALPKKFRAEEITSGTLSVKEMTKEYNRLQSSIRATDNSLKGTGFKIDPANIERKTKELALLKEERDNLAALIKLETSGEEALKPLREDARKGKLDYLKAQKLAAMEGKKAEALEAASTGKLKDAWKAASEAAQEYQKSINLESMKERMKPGGDIEKQSKFGALVDEVKGMTGSIGIYAETAMAGFMKYMPHIGTAVTVLSAAWSVYQNFFKSDEEKAKEKALEELRQTLDNTAKSVKELNRLNEASIPLGLKAAQSLTIQSNATAEIAQKYKELIDATATAKGSKSSTADNLFKAIFGTSEDATRYVTGIVEGPWLDEAKKELENSTSGVFGEYIGRGIGAALPTILSSFAPLVTRFGKNLGIVLSSSLPAEFSGFNEQAVETYRIMYQLSGIMDKEVYNALLKSYGGFQLVASSPALQAEFIRESAIAYDGLADSVKNLQEAFKKASDSTLNFYKNLIPKTSFDDMASAYESINKELFNISKKSSPLKQFELLTSMPDEIKKSLDAPLIDAIDKASEYNVQISKANEALKEIGTPGKFGKIADEQRTKIAEQTKLISDAQTELNKLSDKDLSNIKNALILREHKLKQFQQEEISIKSQQQMQAAIMKSEEELYSLSATGVARKIDQENKAIELQQAQLKTQVSMLDLDIQHQKNLASQITQKIQLLKLEQATSRETAESLRQSTQKTKEEVRGRLLGDRTLSPEKMKEVQDYVDKLTSDTIADNIKQYSKYGGESTTEYFMAARSARQAQLAADNYTQLQETTDTIRVAEEARGAALQQIEALQLSITSEAVKDKEVQLFLLKSKEEINKKEIERLSVVLETSQAEEKVNELLSGRKGLLTSGLAITLRQNSLKRKELQEEKSTLEQQTKLEIERITALKREDQLTKDAVRTLQERTNKEVEVYNAKLDQLDVTNKLAIFEAIIPEGIEGSISALKDALNYYEQRLDLVKETQNQELQIAQNRAKLAIGKAGGKPTEETQKQFEVEAATLAYTQAMNTFKLRMAAIDAEYELLKVQKDAQASNLKAQAYFLQAYWAVSTQGKKLPEDLRSMLNNIMTAAGAIQEVNLDTAKQAAQTQAANQVILAGQNLLLARQERANANRPGMPSWMNEIINIRGQQESRSREADLLRNLPNELGKVLPSETAKLNFEAQVKAFQPLLETMLEVRDNTGIMAGTASVVPPSSTATSEISSTRLPFEFLASEGKDFGPRKRTRTTNGKMSSGYHKGLDFSKDPGTLIESKYAGRVIESGKSASYGNYIKVLREGTSDVVDMYAHMQDNTRLLKDAIVKVGDIVGKVGATGNVTGPHLHYEVQINKKAVDPLKPYPIKLRTEAAGSKAVSQSSADKTPTLTAEAQSKLNKDRIAKAQSLISKALIDTGAVFGSDYNKLLQDILSKLGDIIEEKVPSNLEKITYAVNKGLNVVMGMMEDLGSQTAERLGKDFGPQGKVLSAISNLMKVTLDNVQRMSDTFAKLPSMGTTTAPTDIRTPSSKAPPQLGGNNTIAGSLSSVQPSSGISVNQNATQSAVTSLPSDVSNKVTELSSIGDGAFTKMVSQAAEATSSVESAGQAIDKAQKTSSSGFASMMGAASVAFSAISSQIGAIAGLLKASSDAKIAGIDKEIAAEQKRDGKSSESVAKIDALEKKKDAMARKSFNTQKKLMMAQAVMSTAAAVAGTYASLAQYGPWVAIPAAAIVGALGLAQVGIISSMQYESSYTSKAASTPSTLSIGKRDTSVDLAKGPNANAGGEVSYLRGSAGIGSNASDYRTVGSAYGGDLTRGYGNRGFVVGEKGPEVISPDTPLTVTPADKIGGGNPVNANISIHAIDSKGVQEVLVGQKGNIIKMLRDAANASGQRFMEDVNVNVYTRPSVGKL